MLRLLLRSALPLALGSFSAGLLATSALAAPAARPAPVASLVKAVDIPYAQFTLPNGLRVIVHTDRKAPIVALSVWYHIGSKDEPAGKTGFAHLFEHLMFNGSENADEDFFKPLETVGATDLNGTTWFDRTNYFETVPTGALELALFLESDRMGHLLGAIDKTKLDNQRAVVQNEKRQGDNEPYGLVEYVQLETLFPAGHPYRHSTIGSMADLDRASLDDVKNWFRQHYGPNNAVLVLAGDIDAATARPLVERYFAAIPRGPETARPAVTVPSLPAPVDRVMKDRVATTRLYRNWAGPGVDDPDAVPLDIALTVIGGLSSSRLDNALVRQEKTAVGVSASLQPFEKVSIIEVSANVKPGGDAKAVATRMDALLADFLKTGPTADEVRRAATREVTGRINGLESVGGFGGKAVTLAEGAVYSNDPEKYRKDLAAYAAATPQSVLAAARKWLGRPALRLAVEPGERSPADLAAAGGSFTAPRYYRDPKQGGAAAPAAALAQPAGKADPTASPQPAPVAPPSAPPAPKQAVGPARAAPAVQPIGDLVFPAIERTTLSNGIEVVLARRATVPTVRLAMVFDAGNAADPKAKLGTQALTLALLDEGTTTRGSIAIAEEQERLGATIGASAGMDSTSASLFALKPNLAPSLDLFADVVRNPAFAPAEVERIRAQLLARIASEKTQPGSIAARELPPLLYGAAHPYGIPFTGSGTEAGVKAATRADLIAFKDAWLRPDNAKIFVAGDVTLAELKPLLEQRFGAWTPVAGVAKGAKLFREDRMARPGRIVLIDRPGSPQSLILAGAVLPVKGADDPLALSTANEVLGGSFTSRLNMD
ncbi:MAG: pitrilysin family protein, partial [Sphingomonas sp.]